ncbi:HNH endonuclease [Teredinibacter sp. KSP-S5-2]|uniref:HNH endonuclease n=1 Tax=Teredinibacter sp. KSP-S5-2 TaxID=3034506 RepID=UPI00293463B9|nr:HNH endonuclease [Teredinibacter sp. KSP-S5-2]WNO11744.1 HNH endonuclease [Teredinibacter sp. KSP-S5-2]
MEARILRLNMAGQPIEWINWKEATCLFARDLVAWTMGGVVKKAHGGFSRITGQRTIIELPAIMACDGEKLAPVKTNPPLSNPALFYRDNCQCLYCGNHFDFSQLSRDHVHPSSRGGEDKWENVVAACKRCNQHKGNFLLSEIGMDLLALPYRPNPAEYLALINNARIRGDQMEYLRPAFKRYSGVPI